MAANIEGRVLSRVIRDGDMRPLIDSHVQTDWFADEDTARVFGYVVQHYSKHGEVPSKTLVNASYPSWRVLDPVDSLEPLLEEFRRKRKERLTTFMMADAVELIEENRDYEGALVRITHGVAEINAEIVTTSDSDFVLDWEKRLDYYESLKHNGGMLGLATGFESMDEATAGLQPEQLVCIVATPKIGKSTLALKMALHVTEQGGIPLFVSFEMSAQEQAARFDAFRAGLNHQKLTRGLLSEKEHAILERAGEEAERRGLSFIVTEDISASTTVSGIDAAFERHNPDVVFIDGVYLMHDELGEDPGSPQALTNITRNLKRLAQRRKRPIVMSTQALPSKVRRRSGIQADSIGYSSSFFQDSDVLFGLQEHPDGDDVRTLRIINARNAGKREVTLTWDWDTSTFEERGPAYTTSTAYDEDEDE